MAHFAEIDENGLVKRVLVVDDNDSGGGDIAQEAIGAKYLADGFGGTWKQTSYNRNFRGKYAGIGDTYDATKDKFIPPQPSPSHVWNDSACKWDNPPGYPNDGKSYNWWEAKKKWVERAEDAPCALTEEEKAKL